MFKSDAIIISDLHLGAAVCRAHELVQFLTSIHDGSTPTKQLILNGDVFDSIDFRRLKKQHWKVLSILRKLSDDIDVTWVCGNHDGDTETISHLLGLNVVDETVVRSAERDVLVLHGHQFDRFIERYPITTRFFDLVYRGIQFLDPSHAVAKLVKRNSKVFLRSTATIQAGAMEYARRRGCQVVCCGHTHHAVEARSADVAYFNSGCWTEKPCQYLVLHNGDVELQQYLDPTAETVDDFHSVPKPQIAWAGA